MTGPRIRTDLKAEVLQAICTSPISTVVTNPRVQDNPIIAVNEAFERLTGYGAEEVIGRNCRFLAGSGVEQDGTNSLREAIREAKPILAELLNYKRDGTPFRNAVMIAPLFDADGRLEYFVGSQMEAGHGTSAARAARSAEARVLVDRLTPRQRQVLREMTLGYRNKQIALRLGLSEKTIKMHRGALLAKLHAVSSTDAVRIAVQAGL